MLTIIIGVVAVFAIYAIRKIIFRPRDLWVRGSHRESLPMILGHIDNSSVDTAGEREIRAWLYPEER